MGCSGACAGGSGARPWCTGRLEQAASGRPGVVAVVADQTSSSDGRGCHHRGPAVCERPPKASHAVMQLLQYAKHTRTQCRARGECILKTSTEHWPHARKKPVRGRVQSERVVVLYAPWPWLLQTRALAPRSFLQSGRHGTFVLFDGGTVPQWGPNVTKRPGVHKSTPIALHFASQLRLGMSCRGAPRPQTAPRCC
jgi:hypothetical protein